MHTYLLTKLTIAVGNPNASTEEEALEPTVARLADKLPPPVDGENGVDPAS